MYLALAEQPGARGQRHQGRTKEIGVFEKNRHGGKLDRFGVETQFRADGELSRTNL